MYGIFVGGLNRAGLKKFTHDPMVKKSGRGAIVVLADLNHMAF